MDPHVLVTAATGTVGREVVAALLSRNISFTAASRSISKAKEVLSDVPIVYFDFDQPSTYKAALEGTDRVFLVGPPLNLDLDKLLNPFINYLQEKKIKRVVYLSAFRAEEMKGLPFHVNVEQKLKQLNFDWTILQPSFFSQNFKNYEYENLTEKCITYMPAGDGKAGFVDVADIGEVAAIVITDEQYIHQELVLTGPKAISYYDAAEQLSKVLNKPVRYPNPSPEEYTRTLQNAGAPPFVAKYTNEVYGLIRDGKVDYVSESVHTILDRPPTSFEEVLKRTF